MEKEKIKKVKERIKTHSNKKVITEIVLLFWPRLDFVKQKSKCSLKEFKTSIKMAHNIYTFMKRKKLPWKHQFPENNQKTVQDQLLLRD